jgi:predicted amidohydrolase
MRIGYIQNSPLFGEKEKNFDAIRKLLQGVKADMLVLPELFATGYTFTSADEARSLAETTNGPTAAFLSELSVQTGALIIGGFAEIEERKAGGNGNPLDKESAENSDVYNAALIVSGDEVIGTYRKVHLFNREKLWFSPGNKPFRVVEAGGFRVGVMICFDWIFPEVCRTLALQGMQVLAHPSNLVLPYAQQAMVTRCLENRIFAVTANRIGREQRGSDDFTFTGGSQITGIDGSILSSAPHDQPSVSIVEIDVAKADNKKINAYNDIFGDRRVSFYNVDGGGGVG